MWSVVETNSHRSTITTIPDVSTATIRRHSNGVIMLYSIPLYFHFQDHSPEKNYL